MRFVILGSSGFVGQALFTHLRRDTIETVAGYGSVALDLTAAAVADRLAELIDAETCLVITTRARVGLDAQRGAEAERAMAANIATALARVPVQHCVYLSSLSVYGEAESNLNITEATPLAPATPYGQGKVDAERILTIACQNAAVPLLILRPCKIFGPLDPSHAYGPSRFIEAILAGQAICLLGEGTELRDHLLVTDLVRALLQLIQAGRAGIYNIASGESHSFVQIANMLEAVAAQPCRVIHAKRSKPQIDQRINIDKLLADLPGFALTPLLQGLTAAYADFLERLPPPEDLPI